jgi:hypothetical protein
MKLNTLIAKPQLIKCQLDDEDTVKEYGEAIEWWIWDRQPLDAFLKFATTESTDSGHQIISMLREMILDEEGKPLLQGESTLPTNILMKVMTKMTEVLGK